MKLTGKVAIITGATTGIGEATAELFAREGATVVLAGRSLDKGRAVADAITARGGRARMVVTDVTEQDQCERLVATTLAVEGRVDILFNNAGTLEVMGSVLETSASDWDRVMAANLKSAFLMSRAAIPAMVDAGGGVIVNNASITVAVGAAGSAAYGASKAAVAALTRSIAIDFANAGIRANCVCPAAILTPTNVQRIESSANPQETYRALNERHPIGRLGAAEDVARAVLFLASDDFAFITGTSLMVDGGYTAM